MRRLPALSLIILEIAGILCTRQLALCAARNPKPPPEWMLKSGGVFAGHTARPLRYYPEEGDFVITNGTEFFNRPLYCDNTACRADGGDKPEFSLYLPGRGGNLRFGIRTASGTKWLNNAKTIVSRYRPGSLLYEIHDPLLGGRTLHLTVLPLATGQGLVAKVGLTGTAQPVELVWAFGGANGMRGRRGGDIGCEREPISQFFQLHPGECRGNSFSIVSNTFVLHSKVATIAGAASAGATFAVADANQWSNLAKLLDSERRPAARRGSNGRHQLAGPEAGAPKGDIALPVVVGETALRRARPVYLSLKRIRGDSRLNAAALAKLFSAAEAHRKAIADQVIVQTPDPFINAAAGALNVAADAIWDKKQHAFMHGAVAWRRRLLGWRGPYVGDELGWPNRTAEHFAGFARQQNTNPIPARIPPADANSNLARNETALHSNGDLTKSHYDMNLVAVDAFFRHLLWTGDLKYARALWPVIQRHFAWERRLFRREFGPDKLPLYEAYAAIWASDDMEYEGGGVSYASAYNYFANSMAARVATLLGKNPAPYEREAELIHRAMEKYLWLPRDGWFAEYKDYLGLQEVHPNGGLWTFYHTIDSRVPTPFQDWEMTRYVDTHIAHIPIHGPGVPTGPYYTLPTTSWMPYMWSLNNVVMAEVANTSLGYWEANRGKAAFALFKGCVLDSMFMGKCPGNLGMTSYFDMARHEAQRDFGDAIGVCSRALVEGLFGIHPDALAGVLRIAPGFPANWHYARMRHPDFNFAFRRDGMTETYVVEPRFPKPMRVELQVPALRAEVASVTINGQPAKWQCLKATVGRPRVEIASPAQAHSRIVITWQGAKFSRPRLSVAMREGGNEGQASRLPGERLSARGSSASPTGADGTPALRSGGNPPFVTSRTIVAKGAEFWARFGATRLLRVADPEAALSGLVTGDHAFHAEATGRVGHRTVFAQLRQGDMTWWQPMAFQIRPAEQIVGDESQDAGQVRFRVRNNTPETVAREVVVGARTRNEKLNVQIPSFGDSKEIALPAHGLLPGSIPIRITGQRTVRQTVTNWKIKAPTDTKFDCVNLDSAFNDRVTQIFRNQYLAPRSPFCSLAIPKQGIGGWCDYAMHFDVDDSGLRRVAREHDGQFVLPDGVPFRTPAAHGTKNIVFVSQWNNYPDQVSVPLSGKARHAYLLMAGTSNPMQSRFDNGEVVVTYQDGSTQRLALRNPTNWWPIDQDYFIDDYAFRRPEPIPPRVDLKTGRGRILEVPSFKGRGGKVPGGAATVLDLPLNPRRELKSLTVTARANEVVIGLMAVTLVR